MNKDDSVLNLPDAFINPGAYTRIHLTSENRHQERKKGGALPLPGMENCWRE